MNSVTGRSSSVVRVFVRKEEEGGKGRGVKKERGGKRKGKG